jgi:hypothetical protein
VAEVAADQLHSIQAEPLDAADPGAREDQVLVDRAKAVLAAARTPGASFRAPSRVLVVPADGRADDSIDLIGSSSTGDPLLAVGHSGWVGTPMQGAVVVLDRKDGVARWGRKYFGDGVHAHKLAGRMILLQLGQEPQIASVAQSDGKLDWCIKLDKKSPTGYEPTFASAIDGTDKLYVVRAQGDHTEQGDVRLARIDTNSGKVAWDQDVAGVDSVQSVTAFGDQVLLSRVPPKLDVWSRWRYLLNRNGKPDTAVGSLMARSATTGEPTWTYRGPDQSPWTTEMVGVQGNTAVVLSRRTTSDPANAKSPVGLNQSWLIGLDPTGKERWRQDLASRLDYDVAAGAKVVGDVVLTDERTSYQDGSVLVARDLPTGKVRWSRPNSVGPHPILERSALAGNLLVAAVTGNSGLVAIDLTSGQLQKVLARGGVRDVTSDGVSVTVSTEDLIFTLEKS